MANNKVKNIDMINRNLNLLDSFAKMLDKDDKLTVNKHKLISKFIKGHVEDIRKYL